MSNIREIKAPTKFTLKQYLEEAIADNSDEDLDAEVMSAVTICKTREGYCYLIHCPEDGALTLMGAVQHVLHALNTQYYDSGYDDEEGV